MRKRVRSGCGASGGHRADYLYVLPALGVMLLVIGYPVYYTIDLSFFNTPPNLAMTDKIFAGLDNYRRILRERSVLAGHVEHAGLDGLLDVLRLPDRLRRRARRSTASSRAAACCAASCSFPM